MVDDTVCAEEGSHLKQEERLGSHHPFGGKFFSWPKYSPARSYLLKNPPYPIPPPWGQSLQSQWTLGGHSNYTQTTAESKIFVIFLPPLWKNEICSIPKIYINWNCQVFKVFFLFKGKLQTSSNHSSLCSFFLPASIPPSFLQTSIGYLIYAKSVIRTSNKIYYALFIVWQWGSLGK